MVELDWNDAWGTIQALVANCQRLEKKNRELEKELESIRKDIKKWESKKNIQAL